MYVYPLYINVLDLALKADVGVSPKYCLIKVIKALKLQRK